MRDRRPILASTFVFFALSFGVLSAFSGGPPPGYSGAPGDSDCSACHIPNPPNSGPGSVSIAAPEYIGSAASIPLTVSIGNPQSARNGFQLAVKDGPGSFQGGLQDNLPDVQTSGAFHVNHTFAGTSLTSWNTTWSVPAALSGGPVTFYAAGNASNMNSSPTGDQIYTTSRIVYRVGLTSTSTSWPIGNVHPLIMDMPPGAPGGYIVVVTLDATPTSLGGPLLLPVNAFDPFVSIALSLPNFFHDLIGVFDASGTPLSAPTVWIPPHPGLVGVSLNFAYVTFDQAFTMITDVSNRLTVTMVP